MNTPAELKAMNIQVSHAPTFTPQGNVVTNTVVKFMVGDHGPFSLSFPPGQDTPDLVRAAIQKQIDSVRSITNFA